MPRPLLSGELLRVVTAVSEVECAVRIGSGAVGSIACFALWVAVQAFTGVDSRLWGNERPTPCVLAGRTAVDLGSRPGHLRATPGARHAENNVYASPSRGTAGRASSSDPGGKALRSSGDDSTPRGARVSSHVGLDSGQVVSRDASALPHGARERVDAADALVDRMERSAVRPDDQLVVGKVGPGQERRHVLVGTHARRGHS